MAGKQKFVFRPVQQQQQEAVQVRSINDLLPTQRSAASVGPALPRVEPLPKSTSLPAVVEEDPAERAERERQLRLQMLRLQRETLATALMQEVASLKQHETRPDKRLAPLPFVQDYLVHPEKVQHADSPRVVVPNVPESAVSHAAVRWAMMQSNYKKTRRDKTAEDIANQMNRFGGAAAFGAAGFTGQALLRTPGSESRFGTSAPHSPKSPPHTPFSVTPWGGGPQVAPSFELDGNQACDQVTPWGGGASEAKASREASPWGGGLSAYGASEPASPGGRSTAQGGAASVASPLGRGVRSSAVATHASHGE